MFSVGIPIKATDGATSEIVRVTTLKRVTVYFKTSLVSREDNLDYPTIIYKEKLRHDKHRVSYLNLAKQVYRDVYDGTYTDLGGVDSSGLTYHTDYTIANHVSEDHQSFAALLFYLIAYLWRNVQVDEYRTHLPNNKSEQPTID